MEGGNGVAFAGGGVTDFQLEEAESGSAQDKFEAYDENVEIFISLW
jgi:hypothetical protein